MTLSRNELIRYSRQLVIPEVGTAGQEKLKAAKVAVIGAGGLGSLVLGYLAGAGVGEIGVFDFGPLELSNLHRQLIYSTGETGGLKTELARRRLLEINPEIKVNANEGRLTSENINGALERYDFIADCTDNFVTRAAINKACLELGKTYVHGAVYQFEGQLAVFEPRLGPCLACLAPDAEHLDDQTCSEAGIMGPAAGAVASMQALEVLKLILGLETMKGKFAILDFRHSEFNFVELKKREDCAVCGPRARLHERFTSELAVNFITPEELKARLGCAGLPRVLDLRYAWEHALVHIEGDTWADLDELVKNGAGFKPDEDLVFYCKGQGKSTAAFRALKAKGYKNIYVLKGGLDAWAEKIEKGMTRY